MNKIEIIIDRPAQDQIVSQLLIDESVVTDMISWYPNPVKTQDIKDAVDLLVNRCFKFLNDEGVQGESNQESIGTA